jgi:inorganic pyrophosphatase
VADFNQVLTPGDVDNGMVNTVVEISEGSRLKVEWDRERAAFMLDRVEPAIFGKPCNYGFIPQTLDEDGDELDTLIVCSEPIPMGVWLEAKIVGVLNFKQKIEHHFTHYKDLKKPGSTVVEGWGDVEAAKAIVRECIERWNNK